MADKYNKVEPKLSLGILISLISFIAVALILIFIALPSNSEKIYNAYYSSSETDEITQDHPYVEISGNKVERMAGREETFLLLISSSDCASCKTHIGTFEKYFQDPDYVATVGDVKINEVFNQIYYVSPLDDEAGYQKLVADYEDIQDSTPQLVLFVNGEIVLTFDPTLSTTDQTRNTNVRTFFEDAITLVEESE